MPETTLWGYQPVGKAEAKIALTLRVMWMDRPDLSVEFIETHLKVPGGNVRRIAERTLEERKRCGAAEAWQTLRLFWSLEAGVTRYDIPGFEREVRSSRETIAALFAIWDREPDAKLKLEL